ncbi:PREDICTED: rve domain-containing /RVT_3 domain-containing protein, partial [Prunus dulcis]
SAVSSVLIRSKDNAEHPVHYVSKALQDAEVRYPDIEKLAFALVVSARRLRPYFQAHTIHVLTNQPLRQVLQKPETSGRLVKWAIELGEFDIHYKPRPAMRGQAVADFLSEFTEPQASAATQLITEPNPSPSQDQTPTKNTLDLTQPLWTLFVDGSSNAQGCGAGLVNQDFTAKDASMTAYLQHARHLPATFHAHTIRQNQTLPANPAEARRVRHRSARYLVINGSLYKRGFSLPYLRCLTPEEGHYVLREIHEGICGNHSGARSLAHK